MKASGILILVGGVSVVGVMIYMYSRKTLAPPSASQGRPINSLPARQYSMSGYNPNSRPPSPTFTPFSGVPIVEGLLSSLQSNSGGSSDSQPFVPASFTDQASSWLDAQSNPVTSNDAGTSTYFG